MKTYCGFVAIVGRPNVGKSTLLNHLIGQKISITSKKAQTTRHRLRGVKTVEEFQTVYVDTPGLQYKTRNKLNQYMNDAAFHALQDIDAILFVIEALHWHEEDEWILSLLQKVRCPLFLVINKVDLVAKDILLPFIERISKQANFAAIFPISAMKNVNLEALTAKITAILPESPHFFGDNDVTDLNERFLCAEIIREKLMRLLGQEVPYGATVEIHSFKDKEKITHISAIIWVSRESHKAIVIGKQGEKLKKIGTSARLSIEKLLSRKVFLQLWVKVKNNWMDDARALAQLGYKEK